MGVADVETGGQDEDKMPTPPVVASSAPDYTSQGAKTDDSDSSSCLGQMVHDAQESETGCCICTCEDSFICESLHAWYKCCHFKVYRSPAVLTCEHCIGESATYGRRTFWSICIVPLIFIFLFLLFVEVAFWLFVAFVAVCISVCVIAIVVGGSSRSRY